jgi:hypothetical protein
MRHFESEKEKIYPRLGSQFFHHLSIERKTSSSSTCLRDFKVLSYLDNAVKEIYLKVSRSRSPKLKSNFLLTSVRIRMRP